MKFILGKKLRMSQIFNEDGKVVPVTLVEAGPCLVTQVRNKEKDGYEAVQIGFEKVGLKHVKKPQQGHLKKAQIQEGLRWLREFKAGEDEFKQGDEINVGIFTPGDVVKIAGVSKGKGFQGVVKRHGFKGGPATHGQKHSERAPGSIGCRFPQRVVKGKRMAGRMGFDRTTVRGLKVVEIDQVNNLLAIKGAVPGRLGTLLEISTIKEAKPIENKENQAKEETAEK